MKTDVDYAIKQLKLAQSEPRMAQDCAQRALDALERVQLELSLPNTKHVVVQWGNNDPPTSSVYGPFDNEALASSYMQKLLDEEDPDDLEAKDYYEVLPLLTP